ncbi:MAG: endonuclease [Bacteroidaceae bacterium]|nr:endonuclease [Bacteroidaceae bacterium]
MKEKLLTVWLAILLAVGVYAEIPQGYYDDAIGKSGKALQTTLAKIIDHTDPGYDALWGIYETTDRRDDGRVWDMYSNTTDFSFGSDQCGNYGGEGDCYNREHSIPKSWRGGTKYSDVHIVVPTDGYVNNRRSNYPFGEVGTSSYVSDNSFSKLGTCKTSGYSGTVFEPNDEYKGDFARIYFYAATRYYSECGGWSGDGFSNSFPYLDEWVREMMLRWHELDPVSPKEIERNDAVYASRQANRNPFVDYPELVYLIFGSDTNVPFNPGDEPQIPDGEFVALDATNVTASQFQANWSKHAQATDYELAVWYNDGSDTSMCTLFDVDFTNGVPSEWSVTGYVANENNAVRLASGSKDGVVESSELELTSQTTLTVTCKPYKTSDNSVLYILVDNEEVAQVDCAMGEVTQVITLEPATSQSTISFRAVKSHRVYLQSASLTTGGATLNMLDGFPHRVGCVLSYIVDNVDDSYDYYYHVTAYNGSEKLDVSNTISVPIATEVNGVQSDVSQGVYVYAYNGVIYIDDAPVNAQVNCYSLDGRLCSTRTVHATREVITPHQSGVYIVQIVCGQGCYATRVAVQ